MPSVKRKVERLEPLDCPYPWFGGKSTVASLVWDRFGNVPNYIEPFFGSGAVLLGRPWTPHVETVNDLDGYVANFWRAVKYDPVKVAKYADNPVNENDLHARHIWLIDRKEALAPSLDADPDYFDAKIAGYWVWGICCWIGSGFCSGDGPWQVKEMEDGSRQLVYLSNVGQGVNRQLVYLTGTGQGVNRQRVHLGDAGRGVNRQRVDLSAGRGVNSGLLDWMTALSNRLRYVRVCCGDWTRVCGGRSGNALDLFTAGGQTCGVFLDPPYPAEANRTANLYREDCLNIGNIAAAWAIQHGDDPSLRIAFCGYEGSHDFPDSWECVPWKAGGGYSTQSIGDSGSGGSYGNSYRERVWFSPACAEIKESVDAYRETESYKIRKAAGLPTRFP